MTRKLTVSQIRTLLFNTDKYAVIGSNELTNKVTRDYLFHNYDGDEMLNVIEKETHLLIWE